jgi:hypothetical protein
LVNGTIVPYRKVEVRWKYLNSDNEEGKVFTTDLYPGKNNTTNTRDYISNYNNTKTLDIDPTMHNSVDDTISLIEIIKQ